MHSFFNMFVIVIHGYGAAGENENVSLHDVLLSWIVLFEDIVPSPQVPAFEPDAGEQAQQIDFGVVELLSQLREREVNDPHSQAMGAWFTLDFC